MTSLKKLSLAMIMFISSHYSFGAEALSAKDSIKYAINTKNNESLQTILDGFEAHTDTLGPITLLEPAPQPDLSKAQKKRKPNVPARLQAALSTLVGQDNTYQVFLNTVVAHDADHVMDTTE